MIRVKWKKSQSLKIRKRLRNKARGRKKIFGNSTIPRLCVFRSGKHIYAQLIDDLNQVTLLCSHSLKIKEKLKPIEKARKVGEFLALQAKEKKVEKVVFDRSGFIYHGRVKALAEGARSGGLKF
ncbi:MAG: 50S ribosomal protein L18 [Bdellovibrionales bacterium]|nr:50S ribosomal protein L18 [Bdellovibrionales bacterium]